MNEYRERQREDERDSLKRYMSVKVTESVCYIERKKEVEKEIFGE
jgi:hypothetical protein